MEDQQKFEQWCIVEVLGHRVFAGMVGEQQIAGAGFIRIDVPPVPGCQEFTKLIGPGSIYAITPCTEQVARQMATNLRERPFRLYEPPMLRAPIDDDEY